MLALDSLNATIWLFDPKSDPQKLKLKPVPTAIKRTAARSPALF
jgi:hypothetical protein